MDETIPLLPRSQTCSRLLALIAGVLLAGPALAETCPGNPDAIGTSRTIVVDPTEHPHIGTMQYDETLPLRDHEVVLTFDDGPLPAHSTPVLQILASQCVKATFFMVGRMAASFPDGVRRAYDAGHTIGTHSFSHPTHFDRMPIERESREIEDGIASVKAALGDERDLSPFFRFPGLGRSAQAEEYLASRGMMTWSADFPADDWRHIPSSRVVSLALSRLEAKGKGVLLLHDIQPRTVAALPIILRELKARGFHIVHVVPASPDRPKTATEPYEWHLHGSAGPLVGSTWPATPSFVYARMEQTAAPRTADLGVVDDRGKLLVSTMADSSSSEKMVRWPQAPIWPTMAKPSAATHPVTLVAPAEDLFQIGIRPLRLTVLAPTAQRPQTRAPQWRGHGKPRAIRTARMSPARSPGHKPARASPAI